MRMRMYEYRDNLRAVLMGPETFEWICITSPESASVFLESWAAAGSPHVRVAAVGKATGEVLEAGGITVGFVPSKVRADHLGDKGHAEVITTGNGGGHHAMSRRCLN